MYNTDNYIYTSDILTKEKYKLFVMIMVKVLYAVCAVCIRNIVQENNFLFDWIYYITWSWYTKVIIIAFAKG
jgi:hypothetical protein